jgi:DNA (cytosine-5)-methyltransferase 1
VAAYYNEIDPYCAQWLCNLIAKNLIAPGDVDTRSIVDVRPDDIKGYDQCHFFAGIGGWSLALRLAGWPDDRPVWTGSCPCQPFSAAGEGKAADDERHLAPAWLDLIAECHPPVVYGEQVEAAIGWGWLDFVFDALEAQGYACGASVLPACGVGAPHIRQRVYFVADGEGGRRGEFWDAPQSRRGGHADGGLVTHGLADRTEQGRQSRRRPSEASRGRDEARLESGRLRVAIELAHTECGTAERRRHDMGDERN